MNKNIWLGVWLCVASTAMGQPEERPVTLKVGDTAPKLQVSKWVQGEPVKQLEEGKAYMVEFWATWCGPCIASIPHVNEIHKKYKDKDLIVIGQNVWENKVEAVPGFIKKMGDKMTYRVALDDPEGDKNGKMAATWMQAAGQNGMPAAFLVNKHRKIAWIGHPMTLKESLIEEILADTYDLKKAAADYAKRSETEQKLRTIMPKLMKSMRAKNWDEAENVLNDAEKLLPADEADGLARYRFRVLMGKNDPAAAYAVARKLSEKDPDNAMLQNDLAWTIATSPDIKKRDLDLAETIARRGTAASKEKDPAILDTLARVLFMKDEKQEAIKVQKKAVDLAEGQMKTGLKKILESYEAGKLPDDSE